MAKLYFKGSEISRNQTLDQELLNLLEQGIAKAEKQGTFRSLYDIEIMGVAVYYRKNWRYEGLTRQADRRQVGVAGA
jgi:hypothetical protein